MALFGKLEVEGYRRMTYELTPDAVELGLDAALPATFTLEEREVGRGERTRAYTFQLSVSIVSGGSAAPPMAQPA